jgi:hypothetical protein
MVITRRLVDATSARSHAPHVRGAQLGSFRFVYALFLFALFAYFTPAATWNPVSRFDLTRSIVERGVLDIDPYVENTGDRAFARGHWYTDKAPFPSLIAAPFYALSHAWEGAHGSHPQFASASTPEHPAAHLTVNEAFARGLYVCSLATSAVAATAIGLMLFELLRRRTTEVTALFASSIVVLGTPLLPYATSFYGHVPAAAFVLGAFFVSRPSVEDAPPTARRLRICGALLALAVGCEYLAAVPGAIVGVLVLVESKQRARAFFDLCLGAVGPLLVLGAYHYACFGSPLRTGYSFIVRREFAEGHAQGFLGVRAPRLEALGGLLFGGRRGLLFVAPVAAIGLLGLAHGALVARDRVARFASIAFVALLLVNSGYYMWWGGAATGPRHLVPVMPFLAFGVALAWDVRALRWPIALVGLVSVVNMLVICAVGLEAPEQGNILFEYAYPRLFTAKVAQLTGASNLGVRLGLLAGATLGPPMAWILLGSRLLARRALTASR